MSATQSPYADLLRDVAGLMLAVSGESVTMVKRSAPEQALKLKAPQEWKIYLEFLKVFFNLADRLAAFHLPLKDRPEFMNSLEDHVTAQLKNVLAPALAPDADQMEVTIAIGQAVAESRQSYERFAFVATEDSRAKEEFLAFFSARVAHLLNATGNGLVTSAATLCVTAAIPAMQAAFERKSPAAPTAGEAKAPPPAQPQAPRPGIGNEIKLVSVMAALDGEAVETRWGVHPKFRRDLTADEIRELNRLMNRVTRILGERYAAVAYSEKWAAWQQVGHA